MVPERGFILTLATSVLGVVATWLIGGGVDPKTETMDETIWKSTEDCTGFFRCAVWTAYLTASYAFHASRRYMAYSRGVASTVVTVCLVIIAIAELIPRVGRAGVHVTQNCYQSLRRNAIPTQNRDAEHVAESTRAVTGQRHAERATAMPTSTSLLAILNQPAKTVETWNKGIHDRVFRDVEFSISDRSVRVRRLLQHFDTETSFGRAAVDGIRDVCLEHTGGQALPESETSDERIDWATLWHDVRTHFTDMILTRDDKDEEKKILKNMLLSSDETLLVFLSRYHVVFKNQCRSIPVHKAIEIFLQKMDNDVLNYLRSQAALEAMTFPLLTALFRNYLDYAHLRASKGATGRVSNVEEASPTDTDPETTSVLVVKRTSQGRPERRSLFCQYCKKRGHLEKDCYAKRKVNYAMDSSAPSRIAREEQTESPGVQTEQKEQPTAGVRKTTAGKEQSLLQAAQTKQELFTANAREDNPARVATADGKRQSELLHVSSNIWAHPEDKKKMTLLVDTGAAINLLPTRAVRKNAWPLDTEEKIRVASFSGQVEETKGIVELNVALGGVSRKLKFHVVTAAREPILSMTGLSQFGAVIDCQQRVIRFNSGETVLCSAVHASHTAWTCTVIEDPVDPDVNAIARPEGERQAESWSPEAFWIREIEERGVQPYRRDNVLYCPVGRSTVLPPGRVTGVQLPYSFDEDIELAGTGNGHIVAVGGVRPRGKAPRIQLINMKTTAEQIGSKCGVVATIVDEGRQVLFQKISGKIIEVRGKKHPATEGVCNAVTLEQLTRDFPSVLHDGLGCVKHYSVDDAGVRSEAEWGILKSRAFSTAECAVVGPLVEDLIRHGIAERVDKKPKVVTPMLTVAKGNGQRRLVHDFRLLNAVTETIHNSALDRMRLLGSVPRCAWWSSVDLSKGYNQVELDESIRGYFGFEYAQRWYQFARVPFGWVNSGAHFQNALSGTLNRVRDRLDPSVFLAVYVDDILIGARDEETHDQAIQTLLEELQTDGWSINPAKVHYKQTSIEFLGHQFDEEGVKPSPGLLKKIADLPMPQNKNELRSFFGLLVQLEKFSYEQHQVVDDLRTYLREGPMAFQSERFRTLWAETVSQACSRVWTLDYFDPAKELEMLVDASGNGVGAALFCGGRPVAMFSRRTEKKWAHSSDSEIDGILKALEAFEMWVAGRRIRIRTDNWSAYRAMNPRNLGKPVLRRLEKILAHNPNIEFIAGKDNTLADLLSRDNYLLGARSVSVAAVSEDKQLIREIHEDGHRGIDAVARILKRRGLQFPGMYATIRQVIKECATCERWQKRRYKTEFSFNEATSVSEVVGIDFVGPLRRVKGRKGQHLLVIVDGMSRYMMVEPANECTTKCVMQALRKWQREHGHIKCLVSDAGPCFSSRDFQTFCTSESILHKMAGPGHQSSNGLAERAIQTLMERVKRMAYHADQQWHQVWRRAVASYNQTPHSVTSFSPNELRYGEAEGEWMEEDAIERARQVAIHRTRVARQKWQEARRDKMQPQAFKVGDRVLRYEPHGDKMDVQWTGPYVIERIENPRMYKIRLHNQRRSERLPVHADDLVLAMAQGSVSEERGEGSAVRDVTAGS